MSQAKAVAQPFKTPSSATSRWTLFKTDHPRAIDRYIDYFGGRLVAGQTMLRRAKRDFMPDGVVS